MSRAAIANAWLDGYQTPTEQAIEFARLYAEERLTLQEIADRNNLSRERVRQLIAPFGIPPHRGQRKREEREEELRATHAEIMAGLTTTEKEAERLGYAKPEYLRMALWRIGLHLRRPAMSDADRQQRAKDRYQQRIKRGPKKHGTVSAYKNFGCRCPRCKAANRKYERELRRKRYQERSGE